MDMDDDLLEMNIPQCISASPVICKTSDACWFYFFTFLFLFRHSVHLTTDCFFANHKL